jgi:hypothetical protein
MTDVNIENDTTTDETETLEVYLAVFARVENGQVVWLSIDEEALVGSYDGHVWHPDTEEWDSEDGDMYTRAHSLLAQGIDAVNKGIPFEGI